MNNKSVSPMDWADQQMHSFSSFLLHNIDLNLGFLAYEARHMRFTIAKNDRLSHTYVADLNSDRLQSGLEATVK